MSQKTQNKSTEYKNYKEFIHKAIRKAFFLLVAFLDYEKGWQDVNPAFRNSVHEIDTSAVFVS